MEVNKSKNRSYRIFNTCKLGDARAPLQTGLPVPYILEPYRTVPSIFEPNHLPARNFRARAEPNRRGNVRYGTIHSLCMANWAPRTVHPRTVPYRTEHFRAESPPRSEFSSASRTESRGECTVRYDSVRIAHSAPLRGRILHRLCINDC